LIYIPLHLKTQDAPKHSIIPILLLRKVTAFVLWNALFYFTKALISSCLLPISIKKTHCKSN